MARLLIAAWLFVATATAHEVQMHINITVQAIDFLIDSLKAYPEEQRQFLMCRERIQDLLIGSDKKPGGIQQEDYGYGNRFMFHFNPRLVDDELLLNAPIRSDLHLKGLGFLSGSAPIAGATGAFGGV